MKEMQLTGNKTALLDDDDYRYFSRWRWSVTGNRYPYRSGRIAGRKVTFYLHVEVMRRSIGIIPDGVLVDHENRNKLDCRRSNLRLSTPSENSINRPGKSGYKGVSRNTSGETYCARIAGDYIGNFPSPEDAARAYDREAIARYGQFAFLNFPEEVYA